MSKNKVKIEKIEELPYESDDELEINADKIKVQLDNHKLKTPAVIAKPIKPKKKYELSDEQRQIKAENMKLIHAKKMDNVRIRNEEKQKLAEQEEAEVYNKVQKRIIQEKKQREKLIYNKLIQDQEKQKKNKNNKKNAYIAPDSSDSEEYEPEPKPKPKPKRRPQKAKEEEYYSEPEPIQCPPPQQPYYYRPSLTIH